jgi:3-hydroxyisobutyrate dehydrogenase
MADRRRELGFVGVGMMGLAMTGRLLTRGHRVTVYDVDPARVEAAVGRGARGVAASEMVHVCVMHTEQVEAIVFGPRGIAEAATRPALLVDHSTIDASRSVAMAERLRRETGTGWIDAPVSGGPPSAAEGSLAMFVGGEGADVERAGPVLADLARRATHMGPPGAGLLTKMVNQMLVATCFATMAEAVRFAEKAGLDAARVPEALAGGYADSLLLQRAWPKMVAREFVPPAGYAFQLLKDLDLVAGLAGAHEVATPMTSVVRELYRLLVARGHGRGDTTGLFRLYGDDPV